MGWWGSENEFKREHNSDNGIKEQEMKKKNPEKKYKLAVLYTNEEQKTKIKL